MTIKERQEEIVDEFSMFEDWMDKYEYIISLGKDLPIIDEADKSDDNLIRGCQSRVWLAAKLNDGKIQFTADSDAIITKGIISLMINVFNNCKPEEIINSDLFFVDEIGLKEHLSPTRSNGLVSMIKQIKMYAIAFQTKV